MHVIKRGERPADEGRGLPARPPPLFPALPAPAAARLLPFLGLPPRHPGLGSAPRGSALRPHFPGVTPSL